MSHGVTFWTQLAGLVASAAILVPLLLMLRSSKRPDDANDEPGGPERP